YHWKNGEIILDGDLLAGVDPDELWDDTYIPRENEYKQSDENLCNEKIDQDEIDALLEEAEEFIENYDDEHTKNVENRQKTGVLQVFMND
ncbi:unnamed protein product, partial [Cylindrotheca closterium]